MCSSCWAVQIATLCVRLHVYILQNCCWFRKTPEAQRSTASDLLHTVLWAHNEKAGSSCSNEDGMGNTRPVRGNMHGHFGSRTGVSTSVKQSHVVYDMGGGTGMVALWSGVGVGLHTRHMTVRTTKESWSWVHQLLKEEQATSRGSCLVTQQQESEGLCHQRACHHCRHSNWIDDFCTL